MTKFTILLVDGVCLLRDKPKLFRLKKDSKTTRKSMCPGTKRYQTINIIDDTIITTIFILQNSNFAPFWWKENNQSLTTFCLKPTNIYLLKICQVSFSVFLLSWTKRHNEWNLILRHIKLTISKKLRTYLLSIFTLSVCFETNPIHYRNYSTFWANHIGWSRPMKIQQMSSSLISPILTKNIKKEPSAFWSLIPEFWLREHKKGKYSDHFPVEVTGYSRKGTCYNSKRALRYPKCWKVLVVYLNLCCCVLVMRCKVNFNIRNILDSMINYHIVK